jgi:hypothetical protein
MEMETADTKKEKMTGKIERKKEKEKSHNARTRGGIKITIK